MTDLNTARPESLSVGIVIYHPDLARLEACLRCLAKAVARLGAVATEVTLIDNGPAQADASLEALWNGLQVSDLPYRLRRLGGQGNVGYGRGNNRVIEAARTTWHLVLNPDAELAEDALERGLMHLRMQPATVMVAAWTLGPDGLPQSLVKRYPSLWVLALRGLGLGQQSRRARAYTVQASEAIVTDVTGCMVSGSFMLCRTQSLQQVGGFDPGYFLYFEDFDLSLRLAEEGRIVWARDVRVMHHGGGAARKGWRHVLMFVRSAARFFSCHGWRLW